MENKWCKLQNECEHAKDVNNGCECPCNLCYFKDKFKAKKKRSREKIVSDTIIKVREMHDAYHWQLEEFFNKLFDEIEGKK